MAVAFLPGRSCHRAFYAFEGGQTAASNADSSRWLWPACLVEAAAEGFRFLRAGKRQPRTPIVAEERFRPLRAGKRQPRTPIVADGCGLRAWSKLPRSVLGLWGRANGSLERRYSSRWLWPECLVEAAAAGFRPLRAGKRQPRTPIDADSSRWLWPECLVEAAGRSCRGGF